MTPRSPLPSETLGTATGQPLAPPPASRGGPAEPPPRREIFNVSPINRRRWRNFRANKRGFWSLIVFSVLFFISLFAEFIANDQPFLVYHDGGIYMPAFKTYSETDFGGDFPSDADYRDPYLQKLITEKGGFMVWPPIRYSYDTINRALPVPAPAPPTWMLTAEQCQTAGAGPDCAGL